MYQRDNKCFAEISVYKIVPAVFHSYCRFLTDTSPIDVFELSGVGTEVPVQCLQVVFGDSERVDVVVVSGVVELE